MTMVASGAVDLGGSATSGGLSRSINLEFGYGANLNAYRGVLYTNASGSVTSQFPGVTSSISMSAFYNTRKIPSGAANYTSSSTFSVPAYNTMTVIIRGAGGQGCGADGVNACVGGQTSPSIGSSGGTSQFGSSPAAVYGSAPGGGGGSKTVAGTTQSGYGYGGNTSNAGGSGAGGNNAGGGGGVTVITLTNPLLGGSGPAQGASVNVVIGAANVTANGGQNFAFAFGTCVQTGTATPGGAGGAGSVSVSWA